MAPEKRRKVDGEPARQTGRADVVIELKTLRQFSLPPGPVTITLPSGEKAIIESFVLQLPDASPARLREGT